MSEERPCGIFQKCPKCGFDCKVCDKCGKFACDKCHGIWDDCWKDPHKKHFPKCPKCFCICVVCDDCGKPCCPKCDFGCDCKKKCPICNKFCDDSWDDCCDVHHKKHFPKCPKCDCICLICDICGKFTCGQCDFGCDCKKFCKKCHHCHRDFKICPGCGKPCFDDCFDDCGPQKFLKFHDEFAKCNLCNCIQRDDTVTLGTGGGTVVVGVVAEILCDCTVLRLAPGALILPPGETTPEITTQPTFICCDDIQWVVKQALIPLP